MPRLARLVLGLTCVLALPAAGCKRDREEPGSRRSAPLEREAIPEGTQRDVREVEGRVYARGLVEQLDLVPPDADGFLVVRDLRPLIAWARQVERIMAGPLARAIPALAELGGGTGEARLVQLERARELLELLLAGLDVAGVRLDRGLIVALGRGQPLIVFSAENLDRLGALAAVAGDGMDLTRSCGELAERPGWYACTLGDPQALAGYAPAGQGEALAARLGDRLGGIDLERTNVALSLAGSASSSESIDAVLRTDPGLWELSLPLPLPEDANVLVSGPAPGLRALVPGTSFAWMRFDPAALAEGAGGQLGPVRPDILTGELWFGALDQPDGMIAQFGVADASAAAKGLQALAGLLPSEAIEPSQFQGLRIELDRASIELDGKLVPSIGATIDGDAAPAWAATLGLDLRGRVWAYGDYLSLALGEVQAIPAALGRLEGGGPSPAAVADLPPSLARALLAGEVGMLVHVVLDHWQAPPSEAELDALLAGLPSDSRPSATAITASFQVLAPWSSVAVWLSRPANSATWLVHLSLVPFGTEGSGVSVEEAAAAQQVLATILAGGDASAGYRELIQKFPDSPRLRSYRARVGEAPAHHAAVGMVEVGLLGALAIPTLQAYLSKAKSSEAPAQTQSILSAALSARERAGSCDALIGEAGLTPPLSVACHEGEGGRCQPSEQPDGAPGRYPLAAWADDPIWSALGYRPTGASGHRFHYGFRGQPVGKGGCRIRVQALGDLDGDGVYSTYEREATITADGAQTLTPLRIDAPEE